MNNASVGEDVGQLENKRCQWEFKMIQPVRGKFDISAKCKHSVSKTCPIYSRIFIWQKWEFIKDLHKNVLCDIVHNTLKIETTQTSIKSRTNKDTGIVTEWNTHNENKLTTATLDAYKSHTYSVDWKKLFTEDYILSDSIHIQFETEQNSFVVLPVSIVILLKERAVAGRGVRWTLSAGNILVRDQGGGYRGAFSLQ